MSAARRAGVASLAALAGLSITIGSLHAIAPQWVRHAGLDAWNWTEEKSILERERQRRIDIDATATELADRISASDAIAHAVIEGRVEWETAVDQIVEINRGREGFLLSLRAAHPRATTDRDLHAAYLLEKVSSGAQRLSWGRGDYRFPLKTDRPFVAMCNTVVPVRISGVSIAADRPPQLTQP